MSSIPAQPRRLLLLNPTRYLGNLLIAGGQIQEFATFCRQQQRELVLVLDESFAGLCAGALPGVELRYYPRQTLRRLGPWARLRAFWNFLQELRALRADLAFTLEDDTLSSRLTAWSGAAFRLGCNPRRQRLGFHRVLAIAHAGRPAGYEHRWHSYREVLCALGLPDDGAPGYMKLEINPLDRTLLQKLPELTGQAIKALVAIHPAATKPYKQWPESAFKELCNLLINKGFKPVLIGAGAAERARCQALSAAVSRPLGAATTINACDRLSLPELASLLRTCAGCVGNDSGPSHLASALGVPGVVVFGPSDPAIWGPLGRQTRVLRRADLCTPRCSRKACHADYRCLREISAQQVFDALLARMAAGGPVS